MTQLMVGDQVTIATSEWDGIHAYVRELTHERAFCSWRVSKDEVKQQWFALGNVVLWFRHCPNCGMGIGNSDHCTCGWQYGQAAAPAPAADAPPDDQVADTCPLCDQEYPKGVAWRIRRYHTESASISELDNGLQEALSTVAQVGDDRVSVIKRIVAENERLQQRLAAVETEREQVHNRVKGMVKAVAMAQAERDTLAAQMAAAREVLAFYAKHDNWVDPMPPVIWDGGYKAREALAALDGEAGALLPWPTDPDTPAHCPHCGVHVGPNGVCNEHGPQFEPMKGSGDD